MNTMYSYDDGLVPGNKSISDIFNADCFLIRDVTAEMLATFSDPVKFSASTSIFVKRGECKADISLVNYDIKGPALVNIRQSHILQPQFISKDFEAICIVMSKKLTDALFVCANDMPAFNIATCRPVVPLDPKSVPAFEKLYDKIEEVISDSDNIHQFNALVFAMMQFFYQTGWKIYDYFLQELPTTHGRLSDRFMTLVKQNFKYERFLDFYAEQLEITPKHLSRTIKTQTGVSAVEWIERFVILEAKVLLKSSNLNIQQIADELNFPSQSFFGKYFKKKTGLSPKEFRNK